MILGKMINSAASLNSFNYIGSVDYVLGDAITLNFQLFDPQTKMRFIPPSTAIVKVTFNNMDTSQFSETGSFINALDQSLITVDLPGTSTIQLLDGNLTFTVDLLGDGTEIVRGIIYSALHQVITNISIL
jgi:hypothetical protein